MGYKGQIQLNTSKKNAFRLFGKLVKAKYNLEKVSSLWEIRKSRDSTFSSFFSPWTKDNYKKTEESFKKILTMVQISHFKSWHKTLPVSFYYERKPFCKYSCPIWNNVSPLNYGGKGKNKTKQKHCYPEDTTENWLPLGREWQQRKSLDWEDCM